MSEVEEMPLKSETTKSVHHSAEDAPVTPKQKHKRGQVWLYVISGALGALIVGGAITGIVNA
ncbi:MAG: hypothetical protein K0R51_3503, partial [Cytophagaceae bacterium]|nr:hypothetical protein [Cytophagaceae bacterium]